MATTFTVQNSNTSNQVVDIEELFELRQTGDPAPVTVTYRNNNTSISDKFVNVSAGLPLEWPTGYKFDNTDLSNLFAKKGSVKVLNPDHMTQWAGTYTLNTYIGVNGIIDSSVTVGAWYESILYREILVVASLIAMPDGRLIARSGYDGTTYSNLSESDSYDILTGHWYVGNITQASDYEYRVAVSERLALNPSGSTGTFVSPVSSTWTSLSNNASGTIIAQSTVRSGTGSNIGTGTPHYLYSKVVVEIRNKTVPAKVVQITIDNLDVTASP